MAGHSFTRTVKAPIDLAWSVVEDHRGMAGWARLRKSTLEREGTPAPNGVGAIRRLVSIGPPIREEITVFEPGHVLGYKMLSGVPAKNYNARIELETKGDETSITWSLDYTPRLPGLPLIIGPVIADTLKSLVAEIERRARG